MCKQAFDWYSMHNKRARDSGTLSPQEYAKLKRTYTQILKVPIAKEAENQIERDLYRTFPLHEYFKEGAVGVSKMRNVLSAFANYDQQVGKDTLKY